MGKHALDVGKAGHLKEKWFWVFWSFLPASLAAMYLLPSTEGPLMAKLIPLGALGAIVGGSLFMWAGYALSDLRPSPHQPSPKKETEPQRPQSAFSETAQNVTSYNQSGGITAGTVNIRPQRLSFTQGLANELLAKMPNKNKKIDMKSVGGNSDQEIANQIQAFLSQNGYSVERTAIGMMAPPPDHKIALDERADAYDLIIAPSAN